MDDSITLRVHQIRRACKWLRAELPAFAKKSAATFAVWGRSWRADGSPPSAEAVAHELEAMIDEVEYRLAADRKFRLTYSRAGFHLKIENSGGRVYVNLHIEERLYRDVTDPEPDVCPTCSTVLGPG